MKTFRSLRKTDLTLADVGGSEVLLRFAQQGSAYTAMPRQIICEEGEPADRLFLLLDGSIQVFITDEYNHELVLTYLTGLNIFGEMGYLGQETRRSASIRARTEVKLVEMTYEKFNEFVKAYPEILKVLAQYIARRLKYTSQQLYSMAFDDVQDRVIETIFNLARMPDAMSHPDGVQIRATRQEIGNILGCSRETVGRVIKNLEEKKVLNTKGKTIVIRVER